MHHFYLVEGDLHSTYESLLDFLSSKDLSKENIALDELYESIGVEQAEILHSHINEKSSNNGVKIIIIRAQSINAVAEHALLKICEEPTDNTIIFILIPSISGILGTLRSRAHIIRMPNVIGEYDKVAVDFLKVDKNSRIDIIAEIIANHKDDDTSAPLRDDARMLVDQIMKLCEKSYKFPYSKDDQAKLHHLMDAHKYLSTSGASVKMILEHLALVL